MKLDNKENINIDKIYFNKVQKDLVRLRKNLKSISAWEIEIGVIKNKMNAYRNGGFELTSRSNTTITIDDILAKDETRVNILESNIEYTNFKLNQYKAALELLDSDEHEVINRKYLDIKNKRTAFEKIGQDMNCSKTTAKRWHDSAIAKIAIYNYENIDIA